MSTQENGLHVVSQKKIIGVNDLSIFPCKNRTLLFSSKLTNKVKRTGEITEVSLDEKQPQTLNITYEKKVRSTGKGPKQIKVRFDNITDLDKFMARYSEACNASFNMSEFSKHGERYRIKVWVGTFNMGNKSPKEEFKQFLCNAAELGPEIMFYSAQEADYGSGSADSLFDLIVSTVEPLGYVCIIKRSFWEMRMVIFVSKKMEWCISNVMASTEATGIMHLMGNKGGLVGCFNVLGSPIAIVSSHLNAHQGNVERRNEDFRSIAKIDNLANPPFDLLSGYHHVIWAGDLNYRIDQTFKQVVEYSENGQYDLMWPEDQLNKQMRLGRTFNGFTEGKINFSPTYKFKKGTSTYDAESKRIPAWCDRILIRSFDGLESACLSYSHISHVVSSDHHPVSALWELDIVLPPPPPPPFASVIGVRSYVDISNLQLDIGGPIESVNAEFVWPFSERSDNMKTGTGRGKHFVIFPDDTIPLLVPDFYVSTQHLKTNYIHIVFTVNSRTAIAILPLHFAIVDVSRPFSLKAEYKLEDIGKVTGQVKIVSASEAHIRKQQLRHQKAIPSHQFQTQ